MTLRLILFAAMALVALAPAHADTVVAARTIPARSVIGPDDLLLRELVTPGGITDPAQVIGMEARVALYAGRAVRAGDIGPPAVVDRNQIILLVYSRSGLTISTEGRALDRAGPGDVIRVMNVMSRQTVTAQIDQNGVAHVTAP